MSNLKWGVMAGLAAMILSFILGIVSGAAFFPALVRAGIFGGIFFGLGLGAYFLINHFVPELLFPENGPGADIGDFSAPPAGTRVNISLGDASGAALPSASGSDENDEVGNITDMAALPARLAPGEAEGAAFGPEAGAGIDQSVRESYTTERKASVNSQPSGGGGVDLSALSVNFGSSPANDSDGFGGLPDLDAMAGAFSADAAEAPAEQPESFSSARQPAGGKPPQGFDGDFNPKEIASGIRTVLSKDK